MWGDGGGSQRGVPHQRRNWGDGRGLVPGRNLKSTKEMMNYRECREREGERGKLELLSSKELWQNRLGGIVG